jgi:inhibitor of cysteine peptidase
MRKTLLMAAVLVLTAGVTLLAVPGSRVRAQPVASIALPEPGGITQLYEGCNSIALTFLDGTTSQTVVQAVSPADAAESMWRYDASQSRFLGFSTAAPQASDLLTVNFLDPVWLCVGVPEATTRLSEEDAGSTVELRVGDTMEVVLDGNPTTGFSWETAAVDASVLKQLGEPGFEPATALIGSGGKFTFRFEAVASGQTLLKLVYHRPWEKDVPPEKTFEVNVTVQ